MSDLLQAKTLLNAAQRDLTALTAMINIDLFTDEIFGFHVQQAVEKCLKAWLALLNEIYPYTHDINLLLDRLTDAGCEVSAYKDFSAYSIFAAQIRYVGLDDDAEPIARGSIISQIQDLHDRISELAQLEENSTAHEKST